MKHRKLLIALLLSWMGIMLYFCGSPSDKEEDSEGPPPAPQRTCFVVTTDYSTGGFGVIDIETKEVWRPDPEWAAQVVSSDPVVTSYSHYVFVINRYTYDNISVLDSEQEFDLVKQYSVKKEGAPSTNPHDLEFVSLDKAYLSLYELDELWVINPLTGEKIKTIKLTRYADSDGIPEASGMLIYQDRLYVALQRIDRDNSWVPTDKSLLVVIDTNTDNIVNTITLCGKNPITDLYWDENFNRIPCWRCKLLL